MSEGKVVRDLENFLEMSSEGIYLSSAVQYHKLLRIQSLHVGDQPQLLFLLEKLKVVDE